MDFERKYTIQDVRGAIMRVLCDKYPHRTTRIIDRLPDEMGELVSYLLLELEEEGLISRKQGEFSGRKQGWVKTGEE